MTISTAQAIGTAYGNGITFTFDFSFVPDASTFISVIYNDATGAQLTLPSTAYSVAINAPPTGQIWANSFTVTYPLVGSPIAIGTSITVQRILPLQQLTSLTDQGNFYPEAVETALDTLEMQIQQVSGRSGQLRGTWVSGAFYNYADIIQDGINGANTGNLYICAIPNTSGVWATDLANGDWSLALLANIGSVPLPLSVSQGGTGTNLSTTGGTSQVVQQTSTGASFTVGRLAASNLSNGVTGTGPIVLTTSPALVTPILGAASGTSLNLSGLTASNAIATDASKNLVSVANTGTGNNVLATGPTLVTPVLGAASATSIQFSPSTGGIIGTSTNNNAATGFVGEIISGSVASGSAVPLTSGSSATVTSISLTAGDWDISGQLAFSPGTTTTVTAYRACVSATAGTFPGADVIATPQSRVLFASYTPNDITVLPFTTGRISISATTTYFLLANATFATSTMSAYGFIWARRTR